MPINAHPINFIITIQILEFSKLLSYFFYDFLFISVLFETSLIVYFFL